MPSTRSNVSLEQIRIFTCQEFKRQNFEFLSKLTNFEYMCFSDLVNVLIDDDRVDLSWCDEETKEKAFEYAQLFKDVEQFPPLSF